MKKIKTSYNGIDVTVIKTDKFKSIVGFLAFKTPVEKKMMVTRKMIMNLLLHTCKKYPKNKDLNKVIMDMYDPCINARIVREGNYRISKFMFRTLEDKYTEEGIVLKTAELFKELIFNPNVSNGAFDQEEFNLEYQSLKAEIESKIERPRGYALEKLAQKLGDETPISYCSTLEDLKEVTKENLYQDYLKMINDSEVSFCLAGNIDNYDDIIKTVLKDVKSVKHDKKLIITHDDISKEVKDEEEGYDGEQSILTLGLKIAEVSDFERMYVAPVYSLILGGGASSRLFTEVREENSLAYSCFSRYEKDDSVIVISAGIDAKNYDKTLNLIKKITLGMKDVSKWEVDRVKNEIHSSLKTSLDYLNNYPNLMYQAELYGEPSSVDERMAKFNKVTEKDVEEFSKKVFLTNTYFLKGERLNGKNKDKES